MDSYGDEENVGEEKTNEVPVTSSLFRLNWISDDDDSDDDNENDNNRETKQPQSQFPTSEQDNSARLRSPIRGKQNGEDEKDKDLTVPSSEDLSMSDRNENQSNYGSLGRRLAKKRSMSSTRTPPSPGLHIKNAGVIDVSSKIALRKKIKDNPFNSLEKMAAILLNVEEMKLVMHFMYEYCKNNDVELLVNQLYDILNEGHKCQLFTQVREAISPFHRDQFDAALEAHHNTDLRKTDSKRQLQDFGNVDRPLLREVQFRRRQLELQLQMSEQMKKVRLKHYKFNDDELEKLITVYVSKNNPTLGISVTRGSDPCNPVLIESVHPGGAAAQTQKILPGMTLISIDDEDIRSVSHQAAVFLIRKAFCSHKRPYLKMIVRKPSATNSHETAAI